MRKQLTLEIADPNQPASIEVAGADLAQTVARLESDGRVIESLGRVGQSRWRLHHRQRWVSVCWQRRAGTPAEKGRKVYASNPPPSHAPLATASNIPIKPFPANSVN